MASLRGVVSRSIRSRRAFSSSPHAPHAPRIAEPAAGKSLPSRVLPRSAAMLGVGMVAGSALYFSQHEAEAWQAMRMLQSTQRIAKLLCVSSLMALDYAVCLSYYHALARNDLQSEYERLYLLLQRLQGDQQTVTMKMLGFKKTLAAAGGSDRERERAREMVELYQGQIAENKAEMERLSHSLHEIYAGDTQRDGREQFYSRIHRRNAERLRSLCASNGGVYVKIGQHIAVLDHVFPAEYHDALCSLLANTPRSAAERVRRVVEEDLGAPLETLFDAFEFEPIASASLAQVHVAHKNGVKLAVKVQHEGLREGVDIDLFVITQLVHRLQRVFPSFRYDWLTKEINATIPPELDFLNEVRNIHDATRMLKRFVDAGDVAIPRPLESHSSTRVLTMSFEEGVYVSKMRDCGHYKMSPSDISTLIARVFAEQIFRHGFVHCDLHEGNLLVRPHPVHAHKPQVVLLDHGLYRTLDEDFRRDYARLWQAMILADGQRIETYSRRLNVGELHTMLATVLTMKPWDEVVDENSSKMQSQMNENDLLQLQAFGRHYHDEIMSLLSAVPSDLLLLLKANDCLRHLDRLLHTPVNSTAVMGEVAASVICEEEIRRVWSSGDSMWQRAQETVNLWTDYSSVKSRAAALSVVSLAVHQIATTSKRWRDFWNHDVWAWFFPERKF